MPYKSLEISNASLVNQSSVKQSQFYKGFSTVDMSNPTSKLFDLDLIKQDIINIFNTRRGERVMNPNYGTIIWDLLMEPMTPSLKDALNNDIETICNSDPRATPTEIKLNEYPTGFIIEITLKLTDTDISSAMVLTFDQNIGLVVQ